MSKHPGLSARHPALRLVIAGHDGPARPEIEAAIARLPGGARDRVVVAGPVSDAGRRALLENATLLAYPSIYEGFGFPVLEAMTAGVPVVAARAGSIPEVAGDAAVFCTPDTIGAGLDELWLARPELERKARARAGELSWEASARAHASVFAEVFR